MKKIKLGFFALAAILGVGSAFTTHHNGTSPRTYGVKSESSGIYQITLWNTSTDGCSVSTTVTCRVLVNDGGTTLTQITATNSEIESKHKGVFTS